MFFRQKEYYLGQKLRSTLTKEEYQRKNKWRQNKNFFRHTNAKRIYHQRTHTKTKVLQAEEKWCNMEIQSYIRNAGQMPTGARQEETEARGVRGTDRLTEAAAAQPQLLS